MKKLLLTIVFAGVCASAALADIIPPATFDFTISGTEYENLTLNSQSLLVTGGGADQIVARGSSYIEVHETARPFGIDLGGIYFMGLTDTSTLNYYGGEMGAFAIYDQASAVFEGGRIDYIDSYQNASQPHIEMIVKEYSFNINTDILTGLWADDSAFNIQLLDQSGYDPVIDNIAFTVVPEPATFLMMCSGILLLKKRRVS